SLDRAAYDAAPIAMNPEYLRPIAVILLATTFSAGQQLTPKPLPAPPSSEQNPKTPDDVVRITTNLVQVDAVVTDGNDKPVTDLKPEEIEIYEDNRSQKITNFSYVRNEAGSRTQSQSATDRNARLTPTVRLLPQDVRRTIALVVDDLGLSFQSISQVRSGLKKFVDSQM